MTRSDPLSPDASSIAHVSDTARWVAVYRAMETERPDALFHDPFARRLAGERGVAIVRQLPKGARSAWPMIVRTAVMDEIIQRLVRDGVDTVINLAAGLDTRPYRLALPPTLRWIDVDYPDVLTYKAESLTDARPACRYEPAPADLADAGQRRAVLDRATERATHALVVTEGLLVYLEREQVEALARDIAASPGVRWWLTDLAMPRLLQMLQRQWGRQLANAPFRFAPDEGTQFFAPLGWREAEWWSLWHEALRLGRTMRFARLWELIGRLYPARKREEIRRMSGMALLERS